MAHKYDGARLFGGIRSRNWSIWRRGVYVLAAPLVFAMRFRHVLRRFPDLGVVVAVKTAPLTTVGAMIATAGELLGYILGAGRSTIRYPAYESNRINQISDADRHIVELLSADVY